MINFNAGFAGTVPAISLDEVWMEGEMGRG